MKVLEALIAKGRRVRRPCEQREVAFGLADLSTAKYNHNRSQIVKKGGLKTLVMLLSQSTDVETQQFAALAIANVASYPANRNVVCMSEEHETPREVIAYIINKSSDSNSDSNMLAKQYCAMAIGNIAADSHTHDTLVELGAIDALMSLLVGMDIDIDCSRMAAFAISNFAANNNTKNRRRFLIQRNKLKSLRLGQFINVVLMCYAFVV